MESRGYRQGNGFFSTKLGHSVTRVVDYYHGTVRDLEGMKMIDYYLSKEPDPAELIHVVLREDG
jgi:hypothetical protein